MSNKTISVPVKYEDQISKYIQLLSLQENSKKEKKEEISDDRLFTVKKVKSHRILSSGIWEFLIVWKDNTQEWVADCDCDCEGLISDYLHLKKISTVYCFCRVSTKEQAGDTHVSLDAQESELRKTVLENFPNYQRIKVVKISCSAYKGIPKQLYNIGERCTAGDAIFVYRIDRLSRNIGKYFVWLEMINTKGIFIYSHSEKISYRENNVLFIQKILDAQKESELIGERVKMSIKRRRERGDEKIGRLKYGFKYERKENGSLKITQDIQALEIIDKVKKAKGSAKEIAIRLNNAGIKKAGRKWSPQMVYSIKKV